MTDLFRRHHGNPVFSAADRPNPANAVFELRLYGDGDPTINVAIASPKAALALLLEAGVATTEGTQ